MIEIIPTLLQMSIFLGNMNGLQSLSSFEARFLTSFIKTFGAALQSKTFY